MPRSPTPISSFGPELMTALIAGATKKFEVEMTYASAVRFRQRIYQLRNAMRIANHEAAEAASRTRIQILWGPLIGKPAVEEHTNSKKVKWPRNPATPCMLVISPYDSEFGEALAKVGIRPDELHDDPLSGVPDPLAAYTPKE